MLKGKKQKKIKEDEEKKNSNNSKENKGEEAKGFIHVRARRGQATDSHSLAERVIFLFYFFQNLFLNITKIIISY